MQKTIMLALLLACGTAQAAEWVMVGKSTGDQEASVDVSSIRIAGEIRRAWVQVTMAPNFRRGTGENSNKWWHSFLSRYAFNCGEETSRSEALTIYYTDGTNSSVPAERYPEPWGPVAPDTMQSAAMQFVCAWKPK